MNAMTSTLLAGTIIVIGRIASGKGVDQRTVIGLIGLALALSLIGEADEGLGKAFAALVLLSAVFMYGVPVLRKTGLIK
jgi:hypothetical protein